LLLLRIGLSDSEETRRGDYTPPKLLNKIDRGYRTKKYRTKNDGFIFRPAAEMTISAIADTAVFMWMNSHRGHRGHRGQNDFSVSSVPSVADSLRTFENRYNFPSRGLRDAGIKLKSFVIVERVDARGQAPLFMTGHTGDARVGGGLRILFPFFSDRAVRSVGEHGEYLV
jgi:hypothetical protein